MDKTTLRLSAIERIQYLGEGLYDVYLISGRRLRTENNPLDLTNIGFNGEFSEVVLAKQPVDDPAEYLRRIGEKP